MLATLSKIIDQTAASERYRNAITNLGQELAYLNAAEFAKFWEADAKRADEARAPDRPRAGMRWRLRRSLCTRHARPCAGRQRLSCSPIENVDGRDKSGHDEVKIRRRSK